MLLPSSIELCLCVGIVCLFLTKTVYSVTCNVDSNHNPTYGLRLPNDSLLYTSHIKRSSKLFRVVVEDETYPPKYDPPATINYIEIEDARKDPEKSGCALILEGGTNATYAKIHLKSQRGHGFEFYVRIYGVMGPLPSYWKNLTNSNSKLPHGSLVDFGIPSKPPFSDVAVNNTKPVNNQTLEKNSTKITIGPFNITIGGKNNTKFHDPTVGKYNTTTSKFNTTNINNSTIGSKFNNTKNGNGHNSGKLNNTTKVVNNSTLGKLNSTTGGKFNNTKTVNDHNSEKHKTTNNTKVVNNHNKGGKFNTTTKLNHTKTVNKPSGGKFQVPVSKKPSKGKQNSSKDVHKKG